MRNQRRQNLNTHLNSQSQAAVQLQGTQMQQLQQQQQQQRSSETSLAIALMGIVIMHIGIDLSVTFSRYTFLLSYYAQNRSTTQMLGKYENGQKLFISFEFSLCQLDY